MNNLMFQLATFLLIMFIPISAQMYEVPPTTSNNTQYIRLGSIHTLNQPNISFSKIYRRQIYQQVTNQTSTNSTNSNQTTETLVKFQACQQSPPEIYFDIAGYYRISQQQKDKYNNINQSTKTDGQSTKKNSIIYDYQLFKSQYKYIIDMVFYDNHIFTISSTGVINIYRINQEVEPNIYFTNNFNPNNYNIQLTASIDAINWSQLIERRIERFRQLQSLKGKLFKQKNIPLSLTFHHIKKGYFQFMDGNQVLLFSNGQLLIGLDIQTLQATFLSQQKIVNIDDQDDQQQNNSTDYFNNSTIDNINEDIDYNEQTQSEYELLQNFQSVTKIDENYFAVLDCYRGAIIYKIHRKQITAYAPYLSYNIQKVQSINKQKFGKIYSNQQNMSLVDIKYNKQKNILLILDYQKGVFTFDKSQLTILQNKQSQFILNQHMIFKKQCNLMEFSDYTQFLYLSCRDIYHISMIKWPIIQQKIFPHPKINVKQISIQQNQNIIAFVGHSTFKIMYLDRSVNYFQDDMLDKIVFSNKFVISANQFYISVHNFDVQKPQITCQTFNRSIMGEHKVVLKTTAQCQQKFLKNINRTKQQKSKFDNQDICVYTVYKNLYIWEQGEVPEKTMTILAICFCIFIILMILFILFLIWRQKRARKHLQSLKHVVLQQQSQGGNQNRKSQNNIMAAVSEQSAKPVASGNNIQESI